MIKNRLEKNLKKLKPWAERHGIEAYRLYDRDIPEYPFIVDIYGKYVIVADRRENIDFERENASLSKRHIDHLEEAIRELVKPADIIFKRRVPQRQAGEKNQQYQKLDKTGHQLVVSEAPAKFIVNLYDYLDTGLFLDHRLLRQHIYKIVKPGSRFLNLFSYTGSVSVFAALAGAHTVSVDMSKTYTEWAMANFRENGLGDTAAKNSNHEFIVDDVLRWLADVTDEDCTEPVEKFDCIFLDPPTFSNSKKMEGTFDVARDQTELLRATSKLLKSNGVLIFSTNKRDFKLSPEVYDLLKVKDISIETLPKDFHDAKIRKAFELRR